MCFYPVQNRQIQLRQCWNKLFSEFCCCQECDNQSDMLRDDNETEEGNNDDDESGTEDE